MQISLLDPRKPPTCYNADADGPCARPAVFYVRYGYPHRHRHWKTSNYTCAEHLRMALDPEAHAECPKFEVQTIRLMK